MRTEEVLSEECGVCWSTDLCAAELLPGRTAFERLAQDQGGGIPAARSLVSNILVSTGLGQELRPTVYRGRRFGAGPRYEDLKMPQIPQF